MATRQLNAWNWSAHVFVYTQGCSEYLTAYSVEQYWDGTRTGHDRLMKAAIEHLEDLADRTGLAYRVHVPEQVKDKRWAFGLPRVVEIDRIPF
jgi:hypothetical protein